VGGGNDREEIELVSVGKKEEMTEWWKRGFQYGKRCNHTWSSGGNDGSCGNMWRAARGRRVRGRERLTGGSWGCSVQTTHEAGGHAGPGGGERGKSS
jgi:hypothetical protein